MKTTASEHEKSRVVAVVLNWNRFEETKECVWSLLKTTYTSLEVLIVDNGSTDGSAEKLRETFRQLILLERATNGGYAAGNNTGIRYALEHEADYVLILNNDTTVEPNFLQPMVDAAEADPAIGIVTCKAYLQSNPTQVYGTGGRVSLLLCSGVPLKRGLVDRECEIEYTSGCILLVRRRVFEEIGLFDERFFMYFEDVEFSLRANKRFRLFYTPQGVIYHKSGAGDSWIRYTPTYLYYSARNRFLAFRHMPFPFKVYLFIYSALNGIGKTAAILWSGISHSSTHDVATRIKALWNGFLDGIAGRSGKVETIGG
ncbi:MAG TPA: glycosyltransferase family 2 protein [Bacteroidota bacterium]|nr:glycosyltransferase family 2 protein [Bacteroidota bacterium]